jgi:ABC-type proline/glycine betaine transport system ATPase subunit
MKLYRISLLTVYTKDDVSSTILVEAHDIDEALHLAKSFASQLMTNPSSLVVIGLGKTYTVE